MATEMTQKTAQQAAQKTASKVALVTGGNRGIGLAIVEGLAKQGHRVLLACREPQMGQQAAAQLTGDIEVMGLDLAEPEQLSIQLADIVAQFGAPDMVVNNAGILDHTGFDGLSEQALLHSLQVNALGAASVIQAFAPAMQSRGYGRIVNLSSGWGAFSSGLEGPAAYAISKATLNAITKVAARSYEGNLKINAMCPGWVRTDMGGAEADRSVEEGADTALWLANLPDDGPTGQFFRDRKPIDW